MPATNILTPNTTGTVMAPRLPAHQRHSLLQFIHDSGQVVEAYPINYEEVYNLKGRLLTLVDATFADPEQRRAHKTLVWGVLQDWMKDIVARSGDALDVQLTASGVEAAMREIDPA